jgi:hypothetical protein
MTTFLVGGPRRSSINRIAATISDAAILVLSSAYFIPCARLPSMSLIVILIILLLLFGGGGYYIGPGLGYYGGGGLSLVLLLVIIYLLIGRGRSRV